MKSVTIHNLDDSVEALIEAKARAEGLSLNKTFKLLLRQALGLGPVDPKNRKADFAEFCGVWSKAEKAEFDKNTRDLREVDQRDWQ